MIKKQVGVTLLELMVALTILSILATIGLPSMTKFIQSNQLTNTTNYLLGDIQRTRTEALRNSTIATLSIQTPSPEIRVCIRKTLMQSYTQRFNLLLHFIKTLS